MLGDEILIPSPRLWLYLTPRLPISPHIHTKHTPHSGGYKLKKEITVSRPVIIIGNPLVMPRLDGDKNARLFHGMYQGY